LKLAHTQNDSNVFAYMLQLIYDIYTYIAKTRLSFCAYTDRRDAVNWSIFCIFRSIYTQRNHTQSSNSALFTRWAYIQYTHIYCEDMIQLLHIYTSAWCSKSIDFFALSDKFTCITITYIAKTWHSLCLYTQNDSNVFAYTLQLIYITYIYIAKTWFSFCASTNLRDAANQSIFPIFRLIYTHCNHTQSSDNAWLSIELVYNIHTYIAKTWLSFCTFTRLQNAVNRLIFRIIRSIYMHCNHIHCKDMTQSLLIYTERQQRLCAHAATNIQHSHSYCKDMTQLLRTYTSVQRSKSIDFLLYQIKLHASQSHTLQRHNTVFAHI